MIQKLLTITANTFVETVRQPIYNVLLWVAMFWVGFVSPALAAFTLVADSDIKVMLDVSLATLLLYGLLTSVFSATSVISREIESHTVLTVISKPVSRPVFLLGKYIGVTGAVLIGYLVLAMVLFLTARHGTLETVADQFDQPVLIFSGLAVLLSLVLATFGNFVYGWHFPSTLLAALVPAIAVALLLVLLIDPEWHFQPPWTDFGDLQLVYAIVMAFCGVLILTAFAVALATRFSAIITLMLCAGVFMLGLLSDYYFGRNLDEGPLYQILYALLPNFQFFWVGDPLTQEIPIPPTQMVLVAGYAGIYALAVLMLGIALFQTREVS